MSVGSEMASIFRPEEEPEDLDEPEDMGPVLAEIFADFGAVEASA